MKASDPSFALVSVFCGVISFALTVPFAGLQLGASFSILFAIGVFLILPWALRREMARYDGIENKIASPILYKGNGNSTRLRAQETERSS